MSKNYENLRAYEGWKFAATVKIWAQSDYRKNQRIYTVNRLVQEFSAPYKKLNFSLQMGKTWHFIENSRSKTKLKSLVTSRGYK
jgi:hypothetical protein